MVSSHAEPSPPPSSPSTLLPTPPSLPPPSWSLMQFELENPFQNSPGPFIYALPDLCSSPFFDMAVGWCPPDELSTFPQQDPVPKYKLSSPGDENHYDLDIPLCLTQGHMEFHLRAEQRDDPTHSSSEPSTPACPESSSDRDKSEAVKRPKRTRRRRRRRIRPQSDYGGCAMGPRSINLNGMHFLPWTQLVGNYSWGSGYSGIVGAQRSVGPWLI